MKYLVLETHQAYAVVLDENGCFQKAANLNYQVGETVENIVEFRPPQARRIPSARPLAGLLGLAACLCLVFFWYYQPNFTPYGTLRFQINPDVQMVISRTERVLELEGLNQDGRDLIQSYDFKGKSRAAAAEELVDRAIQMGYLTQGKTVSITVTSKDREWQNREASQTQALLEARYGGDVVIRLTNSQSQPSGDDPGTPPPEDTSLMPIPGQDPEDDEYDDPDEDISSGPSSSEDEDDWDDNEPDRDDEPGDDDRLPDREDEDRAPPEPGEDEEDADPDPPEHRGDEDDQEPEDTHEPDDPEPPDDGDSGHSGHAEQEDNSELSDTDSGGAGSDSEESGSDENDGDSSDD